MNTALAIDLASHRARMTTAFDLVCPGKHARELAARGMISPEIAERFTWRERIAATVLEEDLDAAGLTLADVIEAVEFFTATSPTVEEANVASEAWVSFITPRRGFLILADGYRLGPAGDH